MSVLTNPVLVSVIVLSVLCLLKVNIIIAMVLSALTAGLIAGMSIKNIMGMMVIGMGNSTEMALAFILLGALVFAIQAVGLPGKLSTGLQKVFGKRGAIFALVLAAIACLSQSVVLVHTAFIPILIPPLLKTMNDMQLDRRTVACSLGFGLKAPYLMLPVGFGLIFHELVADSMTTNGMHFDTMQVWKAALLPGLGMVAGLLVAALFTYRKKREYNDIPLGGAAIVEADATAFGLKHWGALAAVVVVFVIQLMFDSLLLGAVAALVIMLATGGIRIKDVNKTIYGGIAMMGFMAFVFLAASGYANVIRVSGAVNDLVNVMSDIVGASKLLIALFMLLIGLIVTMGIGSSFATVPVIAAVFVPLCLVFGFSPMGTACLIVASAALGDAGSPVSDSTMVPSAGLNADGQHDHIWDTCVPSFLHYNLPLLFVGLIAAMIL